MVTDYKNVIDNFRAVSAVPRGSGHNEKINAFLMDFALKNGLEARTDEALNVCITKPASEGFEDRPPVILQGHMDMVCVADPGIRHNFETEGIELREDGDWLYANGTTLGGDDGISMAYMMSLLADRELKAPRLICIITTDEETGMDGAKAMDPEWLEDASFLINLDSENEKECLCGCAGGLRIDGRVPVTRNTVVGTRLEIRLAGLRGGHSGAQIHMNITNAIRLMARIVYELSEDFGARLVAMNGGEKDNAIPSSAHATLLLRDYDREALEKKVLDLVERFRKKEPDISVSFDYNGDEALDVLDRYSFNRITCLLLNAPDGLQSWSADIEGLVETSLNLGIFEMTGETAGLHYSLRSSVTGEKEFLCRKVMMCLWASGGTGTVNSEYPAWEYREKSELRDRYAAGFRAVKGEDPVFNVIHAGLECGLFAKIRPELDMISIGPDMKDIHSPKERLNMRSSVTLYRVLENLLSGM